jgi:glucose repression regulatory protein TUP1
MYSYSIIAFMKGALDEIIRVWDLRTGHLLERFEGHEKSVYSVSFSPDGQSIVTGSLDQTIRIWNLSPETVKILANPPNHEIKPEVIRTMASRQTFSGHGDYVLTVAYPGSQSSLGRVDPDGRPFQGPDLDIDWVLSGGKDRNVMVWNAKDVGSESSPPLIAMLGHKNSGKDLLIKLSI